MARGAYAHARLAKRVHKQTRPRVKRGCRGPQEKKRRSSSRGLSDLQGYEQSSQAVHVWLPCDARTQREIGQSGSSSSFQPTSLRILPYLVIAQSELVIPLGWRPSDGQTVRLLCSAVLPDSSRSAWFRYIKSTEREHSSDPRYIGWLVNRQGTEHS